MAPLPAPEPSKVLETLETMDARKIRFERNRIRLPMGVEGTFGIIRHPGASLAVPITADGQVVILRQYRFAVQARLLEFPAGTLEEGKIRWNRCSASLEKKLDTALPVGIRSARCCLVLATPTR